MMQNKNTQTEVYVANRSLKQHEEEMLELVAARFVDREFSVLDIGCADGLFCKALKERFPRARVTGFDLSAELISQANSYGLADCEFTIGDASTYETDQRFDLLIASGILSVFEDFEVVLGKWLEWLRSDGLILIFGRFNSEDIDMRISIRNNFNHSGWEGGLTTYSLYTVGRFLEAKGYQHEFHRFRLSIDLPRDENPVRTYTIETVDGEKLVVNGANLLAEQFFLKIWKPAST
jgi:trans-aconitate methyltransferase